MSVIFTLLSWVDLSFVLLVEEQRQQVDIVCDKLNIYHSAYTFISPLNSEHLVDSLGQGVYESYRVLRLGSFKFRSAKKEENGS